MISGSRYNVTSEIARQQRLARDIAGLQTDISSQVRVRVASDDPVASARIARIGVAQADGQTYAANVDRAGAIAERVDTAYETIQTALVRFKELTVQAANGTLSASDRGAIATALKGIVADIDAVTRTTDSSGNALFVSGTDPIAIPVGRDVAVAAADSYDAVFGRVPRGDGTTATLAALLGAAVTAVETNDPAAITASLDGVDATLTRIGAAQEDAGVRSARIKAVGEKLASTKIDLADERAGLEETDLFAASATLKQKMVVLDAAQSILAQLGRTSLFDKIS